MGGSNHPYRESSDVGSATIVDMTYLEEIASDIRAEVDSTGPPDDDTRNLFVLYAVLAEARGSEVTARDVHDAWSAWMILRGEAHRSLVPFDELPAEQQTADEPFVEAIRRVARRRGADG